MRTPWLIALLAAALALAGCGGAKGPAGTQKPDAAYGQQQPAQQGQQAQTPADPNARPMPNNKQWSAPPAMQIDPNKQYVATISTNMGDMKVELFAKDAPLTVNNFVFLAKEKFYDGIIFHRVLRLFMIQTGDPTGTGAGGPGYKFADELPPKRPYDLGIVAMANAGANTNGSQFFICVVAKCGGLDDYPKYTQFGKVTEGLDVLEKLAAVDVTAAETGERSRPVVAPWIKTITVEAK